jgi:hypothetical protein
VTRETVETLNGEALFRFNDSTNGTFQRLSNNKGRLERELQTASSRGIHPG